MNRGTFLGTNSSLAVAQATTPNYAFDGPAFCQNVPKTASFSTFGSGLASATDKAGRLQLAINSGAGVLNGLIQSSIATPYTIDLHAGMVGTPTSNDANVIGIAVSNGTALRAFYAGVFNGSSTSSGTVRGEVDSWNSPTSFSAVVKGVSTTINPSDYYARITDDGTTRKMYLSENGLDFFLFYSEPTNTFVTPTKFAIVVYNNAANSLQAKAYIYSYLVSSSILGDAP